MKETWPISTHNSSRWRRYRRDSQWNSRWHNNWFSNKHVSAKQRPKKQGLRRHGGEISTFPCRCYLWRQIWRARCGMLSYPIHNSIRCSIHPCIHRLEEAAPLPERPSDVWRPGRSRRRFYGCTLEWKSSASYKACKISHMKSGKITIRSLRNS